MFDRLLVLTLAFHLLSRAHGAATCEPRAISLPFKGQKLANQAQTRGVSMETGNPKQVLSFLPCAAHFDTYVYGTNITCDIPRIDSSAACMTSHGGYYNQSLSSSASRGDPLKHVSEDIAKRWAKDHVTLGDNTSLQTFDFSLPDAQLHGLQPQAEIGVGANSTFIAALKDAGTVSSRSYSLFWGDEFTEQHRDGSVVFGGYDKAIIGDSRVTKAFNRSDPDCPQGMMVRLTAIHLSSESGTVANIFDGLEPLDACLEFTMRNIMALPFNYGDRIIKGMGAERADEHNNGRYGGVLANTAVVTPNSATFKGNLSITVEGAVTINFTTEQLLFNDHFIDSSGLVQTNTNLTNVPLLIEYPARKSRLGGMFFSSAYLMVNHDKDEFTIAEARAAQGQPDIVGIDTANDCVAWLNGTTLSEEPSTPAAPTPTPDSDAKKLSTGTIAGIAIGAVAGIALIVGVGFLIWRRIRQIPPPQHAATDDEKYAFQAPEPPSELPSHEAYIENRQQAAELDGGFRATELR
ncbi:hypothetical protein M3J09_000169 [Ascochyta lentis]